MIINSEIIIILVFIMVGLASLFMGVNLAIKCSGKLRLAITLILGGIIVLMTHEILNGISLTGSLIGLNFPSSINLKMLNETAHIIASLMTLISLLILNNIFEKIRR